MEQNQELLTEVYENALIGKETLGRLIKRSKDANFRNVMADQFAEYHNVLTDAEQLGQQFSIPLRPARAPKAPIHASMCLNLAVDQTSSHMAEMILQGSMLGIIDLTRALRACPDAAEEIRALADRLLKTEENHTRQMYENL